MWGDMAIKKTVNGLENANVDIIEIGFLKNESYMYGSSSFQKVEEMKTYLKKKRKNTLYVALVDYGRYDLKYLSDYDGQTIDAIRVCFKKDEIGKVLDYARQIQAKGYQVCIQHVDTLGFSDEEIVSFVKKVNEIKPFAYSIVDTFGAMYESDMLHYCDLVSKYLDENIWLGFHGHNNLMLADANAQSFFKKMYGNRKIIVDTSLYGCGRSAGNAHTELMAQFLMKKYDATYDINELLDLIDTVVSSVEEKVKWGYCIPYFISGMHNAHTFNVKHLLKRHNIKSKDLRGIIEMLDERHKKMYDYALLEKLYVEYFDQPVNDSDVVKLLSNKIANRKVLLLAPGRTIVDCKQIVQAFVDEYNPIVIGINNLIEGFILDYIFYSGVYRYQNLQYQNYRAAGSPEIIISSNIKTKADKNELIVNYNSLIKFGWINLDSSAILLLRLLIRCDVRDIYVAGLDGYAENGKAFYKQELDTGLNKKDRIEHTKENIEMLEDLKKTIGLNLHFLTESIYSQVFEEEEDV